MMPVMTTTMIVMGTLVKLASCKSKNSSISGMITKAAKSRISMVVWNNVLTGQTVIRQATGHLGSPCN